jgi:hypothetical protein
MSFCPLDWSSIRGMISTDQNITQFLIPIMVFVKNELSSVIAGMLVSRRRNKLCLNIFISCIHIEKNANLSHISDVKSTFGNIQGRFFTEQKTFQE